LIITDFGDITAVTDQAPMDGRLWRVDVGVEGLPLFRGSIAVRS
jgi:gluconolactonase